MVEVEITSAGKHFLMARLVEDSLTTAPDLPAPLPKGAVSGASASSSCRSRSQTGPDKDLSMTYKEMLQFFFPVAVATVFILILRVLGPSVGQWL